MSEGQAGEEWPRNYFNYFTEVEEHFQKARGTGLFLMSPLDWALVESWKNAGIPLAAVLRGIDEAFEKWRSRKNRTQMVNSLAYCVQAVMQESQAMAGLVPAASKQVDAPFELDDLRRFLSVNAQLLKTHGNAAFHETGFRLEQMAAAVETHYADLQELEQRLTAMEEKLSAIARTSQSEDELFEARKSLDAELRPYRGKMSTEQLSMLERQYLDRLLFERAKLPRLSLFYLF